MSHSVVEFRPGSDSLGEYGSLISLGMLPNHGMIFSVQFPYRIISQIGKITKTPKRRGYSSGRIKGYKKAPRSRHQVIKKTKKVANQKLKAS